MHFLLHAVDEPAVLLRLVVSCPQGRSATGVAVREDQWDFAPGAGLVFQVGREHIFDPFHECADPARQVAPMRYYQGDVERPVPKIW